MESQFFCCACGQWRSLASKVEGGGRKRAECQFCVNRARTKSIRAGNTNHTTGAHRSSRPLKKDFIRWATHV